MTSVDIRVYEPDNETLVCSLNDDEGRAPRSLSGKEELEGPGLGELVIDRGHPRAGELTEGRWVQVHELVGEEADVPLAFRVGRKQDVRVPAPGSQRKDRLVTVRGEGPRWVLRKGLVRPRLPLSQFPKTNRRGFSWYSPEYDPSTDDGWTAPFVQDRLTSEPGKPFGAPDVFRPQWIYGEAEADMMTIGDCVFRRVFTLDAASPLIFLSTGDDRFAHYFEGTQLHAVETEFPATTWHKVHQSVVKDVQAGTYVFGGRATNDGGKGAFFNETWRTGPGGITTRVCMTGVPQGDAYDSQFGSWLCYMNPTGEWFTVGEILRILVGECHDRFEVLDLQLGSFTDTHDSNGVPWPRIEVEFDATSNLETAAKVLEPHADIVVSNTGGLILDAYVKDPGRGGVVKIIGTDTPADLTVANGALVGDTLEEEFERETIATLVGDKGLYEYADASVFVHGRLPGDPVNVGGIDVADQLNRIGAEYLGPRLEPQRSRIVQVAPRTKLFAHPGDSLTVEGESGFRIHELELNLTDKGLERTPALDSPVAQRMKRSKRSVDYLIRQYGELLGGPRAIDLGSGIDPGPVDTKTEESWSWNEPEMLDPEYWEDDPDNPRAWQRYRVPEAIRLVGLVVTADWADQESGEVFQNTVGQTRILLLRNNQPTVPPFIATLPESNLDDPTNPEVWAIQFILGPAYVGPGETLSVTCIENGDHMNGSIEILATKAL